MFIVIEGMDNSGKTTLINYLKKSLLNNPLIFEKFSKIHFTSEPYGPEEFKEKFSELSSPIFSNSYSLSPVTESLLFLAIRAEHLKTFIKPKLEENSLLICDRYFLSTLAYQSYLKGVSCEWLSSNMKFISEGFSPNLVFIVNVSEEDWKTFTNNKRIKKQLNKLDCLSSSYRELSEAYKWASEKLIELGENVINIPSTFSLEEKVQFIINKIVEINKG
ncbi:dTMP kinase [Mycoplasma suis]|uniref:Thymidylate kinase n=1 Tax=Mycoplasma suis (strain Illinois) TaxID=768700 RepID=F0QS80_MYCSL|nr:dTMP kinase [Mycoplasma suis]ADX98350.1 thymidylate kinase [Mycoplasma suis str. Illinois]